MSCTGAYASPEDFVLFWDLTADLSDPDIMATMNRMLAISAADLHGPLSAVGACDCISAWGLEYLKKLNIIEMGVFYKNPCGPQLSEGERRLYLEWMDRQMELIRTSKLDLCGGTGAEYPAVGSVELNLTSFNEARIIANRIQRTP
mgnify:FL=1